MDKGIRVQAGVVAAIGLYVVLGAVISSQGSSQGAGANRKESSMTTRASGTFDAKLAPLATDDKAEGAVLGRMALDKVFRGDLEGTAKGEMLTAAGTSVKDSAGYVAIERFTGTLHGRKGTFALQHNGIMTRGVPQLTVTVVPDSGSGQLTGLAGRMEIKITDGKHFYELDYTLPKQP